MSLNALIATFFGIGRIPYAPGTAASLVAALLAWPIASAYGHWMLLPLGIGVGVIGVLFSGAYAKECGRADPSECVIDEVAGQWVALAFAPVTWQGFLLAFALFRYFDISKPWPISEAEKFKGGLGVVSDDIVAGVFSGLVILLFVNSGYL
jgi:phosphatidylglycerophosphatase A